MHPQALLKLGPFEVYAYGLCMAFGIIACFGFLLFAMWKMKFNEDATDKILLIGVFGTGFGIFASMVFQSIYNYAANPSAGFELSGMTFIGGLIGGVASFLGVYWLYIYVVAPSAKKRAERCDKEVAQGKEVKRSKFTVSANKLLINKMNATLTDALPFIPIGIVIAHAFGRLGCFFGGCCYGKPAEWGLKCAAPYGFTLPQNVIPTQLFEMSFLIILGAVMALLYFRYRFYYNFSVYTISYGIWRFIIEFFRDDDRGAKILGLQPSQFWSILMVLFGVGYVFLQMYVFSKHMKHPELKAKEEKKEQAPKEPAAPAEN